MAQPIWVTPAGSLGTIPEGIFFQIPILAYDPDHPTETLRFEVIAGNLPSGIQCNDSGLVVGIPKAVASVQGVPTEVNFDVTSKFAIRVYSSTGRLADRTFSLTVTGPNPPEWITPSGQIGEYFDGSLVSIQLEYQDNDPADIVSTRIIAGSLPEGLTLSSTGLISGVVSPITDTEKDSEFIVELTDGTNSALRTFNIQVWNRNAMTADNDIVTADNDFITSDSAPYRTPILLNPEGSIGIVRNDNFFAYQFIGSEPGGGEVGYLLIDEFGDSTGLPGLTLDPLTGWLYGYIPNLGVTDRLYNFSVRVFEVANPYNISDPYNYSIEIVGPINTAITWLVNSNLGTINNGATSTLYVEAINADGIPLQYELLSGSASSLPQGLQLLPSGLIAGRTSFNTFALDNGETTFDATNNGIGAISATAVTTFDMVHTFTVRAYSINGLIDVTKVFSITVNRLYNNPYENLYIQCMPPLDDRDLINSLLQNADIFQPDLIYRQDDPNFGISTRVVYNHAFGLTASTIDAYVSSLDINHYWKNLTLGAVQVAQAVDSNTNEVIYEVVYSRVIDDLVNAQGESVSKEVTLPYPVYQDDSTEITTVYPNSLIDMRDQVIDTVGQVANVLPLWMTSKQADGNVLGFVPAWVIAYAKPGKGKQLAYYIQEKFGERLNLVDFEVDRYELDRFLTKYWDPIADSVNGHWVPHPPEYTRFDSGITDGISLWGNFDYSVYPAVFNTVNWVNGDGEIVTWTNNYNGNPTTFDGNSMMFTAPNDMYGKTQVYDKYLVFPRRNILG